MGRRKKNRYRIKTNGLKIEQSLLLDWARGKTGEQIIKEILKVNRFFSVLESFDNGGRSIELIKVRVHEEGADE